MDAKELLERVEKLPEGWRHPKVYTLPVSGIVCFGEYGQGYYICDDVALDLHLRTIAEKLAERGWMIYLGAERWNVCDDTDDFVLNRNTYVEAAISAAEECNKQ